MTDDWGSFRLTLDVAARALAFALPLAVIVARVLSRGRSGARVLSLHNVLQGRVRVVLRDEVRRSALVEVSIDHGALLSRVTLDAVGRLGLAVGAPVLALVKSMSIEVVRGAG